MIRKDLYYFILLTFVVLPALIFTVWGGPFMEVTIFDYLADEYFYAGTKRVSTETVNIFSSKDPVSKVKSDVCKFKAPFEMYTGENGIIYLNFPEAVVVIRPANPKLIAKQRLHRSAKTALYVSSPEVGKMLYNRHGRVYVHIHPRYRSHYRSRYGSYFRGRGSKWGK